MVREMNFLRSRKFRFSDERGSAPESERAFQASQHASLRAGAARLGADGPAVLRVRPGSTGEVSATEFRGYPTGRLLTTR